MSHQNMTLERPSSFLFATPMTVMRKMIWASFMMMAMKMTTKMMTMKANMRFAEQIECGSLDNDSLDDNDDDYYDNDNGDDDDGLDGDDDNDDSRANRVWEA